MITVTLHDDAPVTPYEELALPEISPQGSWSLDMGRQIRYLKCLWGNSNDLIRELIGHVTGSNAAGTSFDFFMPHKYGGFYTDVASRVVDLSYTPFGKSEAMSTAGELASYLQYPEVKFTVTYETAPSVDHNLWLLFDERFDSSVEFVTIPGRKLFWDNANPQTQPVGEDESPGILFGKAEWTYIIKRIPKLRTEFMSHRGHINQTAVTSPKYNATFPIGTLLYENVSFSERTNHMGDVEYTVEMRFIYNELGWNIFPRAGYEDLKVMYKDDRTLYEPYGEAELNDLLLTSA